MARQYDEVPGPSTVLARALRRREDEGQVDPSLAASDFNSFLPRPDLERRPTTQR
jgi:hypothetical protein